MTKKKSNNLGIASLILGISSTIFCWVPFLGIILGVLGIIFSVKQKKIFPNNINTAGLVTSIIGLVLSFLYNIFWLIMISVLSTTFSQIG